MEKKQESDPIKESIFECKREGLTIRGTEYRPAGENLPTAIGRHGFVVFQDTVRQCAKLMAEPGYVLF